MRSLLISVVLLLVMQGIPAKAQSHQFNMGDIHYIKDDVSSFDTLLARFKGKIVYVDIWATWCGPCVHDLRDKKSIKALEDFAFKNDMILLYMCCDKDEKSWKPFIEQNKLSGYHIRENDSLKNEMHARFSFFEMRNGVMKNGFYIPRHLIIDEKGAVVDSMADRQGNPLLYTRLNKLLKNAGK